LRERLGTAISEVGTGPKVTGLVYVAAGARCQRRFRSFVREISHRPGAGIQVKDGYTLLSEDAFLKYFANGVDHSKAEVLYAKQGSTAASIFAGRTTAAAWHSSRPGMRCRKTTRPSTLTSNDFSQNA
jgi:hypothetical protein